VSDRYPRVEVASRQELHDWLAAHGDSSPGIWLVTAKKVEPERYVPYGEIVEEAICFGWVDSRSRSLDDRRTMLLLTPRRPRSNWSASNRERVARLIAEGRMQPAGLAAVEAANTHGTWTASAASSA
jgi:uncharacterized protein YdeI (YjbR/CyaY-like superfamily)